METVKQDAAFVDAMLDHIQGLLLHILKPWVCVAGTGMWRR